MGRREKTDGEIKTNSKRVNSNPIKASGVNTLSGGRCLAG